MRSDRSLKEKVIAYTKDTGVLPCIKLHEKEDFLAYAQAMYDGGTRVLEVTMTTPGVLEAIEAISEHFGDRLLVAAGTVLDPASAREVIPWACKKNSSRKMPAICACNWLARVYLLDFRQIFGWYCILVTL